MASLKQLIGFSSKSFELLYRGTRDGFAASVFHSKCDGIKSTLIVIKETNGYVFGGYTSVTWDSSLSGYKPDSEAFIYTFLNPNNSPLKLPIITVTYGICNNPSYGPTFGGGHDILVTDNSNMNSNNYLNGHSYTSGYSGSSLGVFFKGGSYNFMTAEIEVFRVFNFDSAILSDLNKSVLKNLINFESKSFELMYRASRDGWATKSAFCNKVPNTLTVIKEKNNGYVFGGFTSQVWSNVSGYSADYAAFLFTLSNPSSSPMKLSIKPENASIAIYNNESDFIARFGLEAYHDLRVGMNSNLPNNDSSIRVGNAYESPNNLSEIDAAIFIKGGKDFLGIFRSCIFFKVLIILSFKRGQ